MMLVVIIKVFWRVGGAFTWSTLEVVPAGGGVDEKAEHTIN